MLFLFSQTWPDTWKSISKCHHPVNRSCGGTASVPIFRLQKLLKSRNFSWTLCCFPSRLVPSDVWQRDQHTSHVVLTCFIIFIKVGFLSTSAMFYQWVGYLKCQIPMVDQPPQKMLGRSIGPQLSGASVCQRPRRNSLRPRQEWGPPEGDGPPETSSLGYPKGVLMLKSDPESMGWGKLGEWPSKKGDALLLKLHHPNDHQWPTVRGVLAKSGVWKLVIMCKPNSKPLPRLPKMAVKIIPKRWVCHRLDRSHWGLISTDDASDEKRGLSMLQGGATAVRFFTNQKTGICYMI